MAGKKLRIIIDTNLWISFLISKSFTRIDKLIQADKIEILTHGRTESILMSLPPTANWEYANQPKKNSLEEKTLELLKKGINWAEH